MIPMLETAAAGAALILASFALAVRELLLRSEIVVTPNARRIVHLALAAACLVNLLRGASLLFGLGHGGARLDPGGCVTVVVWSGYCVVMAIDVVLDRLPPRAWANLRRARRRLAELGRCRGCAPAAQRPPARG